MTLFRAVCQMEGIQKLHVRRTAKQQCTNTTKSIILAGLSILKQMCYKLHVINPVTSQSCTAVAAKQLTPKASNTQMSYTVM